AQPSSSARCSTDFFDPRTVKRSWGVKSDLGTLEEQSEEHAWIADGHTLQTGRGSGSSRSPTVRAIGDQLGWESKFLHQAVSNLECFTPTVEDVVHILLRDPQCLCDPGLV